MAQVEIRNALETRLAAFATATGVTVLYENDASEPIAVTHLRPAIFPSPTKNPSMGAYHRRYNGIFKVQCWVDSLNNGPADTEALAEELVAWFPRGLELIKNGISVHIENTPSQSGLSPESNHCVVTVEMIYRADVVTI